MNESKLTLKVKSLGKTFLQKYLARNRYNYYMYMYPKNIPAAQTFYSNVLQE